MRRIVVIPNDLTGVGFKTIEDSRKNRTQHNVEFGGLKLNKNLTEDQQAVKELLEQGASIREAARVVLERSSKESTIRGWISNGLLDKEIKFVSGSVIKFTDAPQEPLVSKTFNRFKDVYKIETVTTVRPNVTHLMIPDTQCKAGISLGYLEWLGAYIVGKQPEVIVHIGDHADMESLSSYDKGKKSAEGKRVQKDIEASIAGMNALLKPLYDLQQSQLEEFGEVLYKPKMVITLGNHEQRIMRHVDANPELADFLSYDNLRYKDFGWEVYDFLEPAVVNGVAYVHYMASPLTGKPYGGTALNVLKNVGESFCMGHKQCLDVATRFLPSSGKQQWAIIAGAYYEHDEGYKGIQGNKHWRGVCLQHNVKDGSFNPTFVDLEYLKGRYNK